MGIPQRVPLTSSRVAGRPEPPPPYRVVRTLPDFGTNFPIFVMNEPGTRNLLLSSQAQSFGESIISRIVVESGQSRVEMLFQLPDVAYSLACHPQFEQNGYLFVGSNGPRKGETKHSRITRYTVSRQSPYLIDPESAVTIIEWKSNGHDGAAIAFGNDGLMYVTTGDGTSDSDGDVVGQRLDSILAKVLRIDVDHPDGDRPYSIPPDNPFLGIKDAVPETWAYGVRAPWRAHVDRVTGQLWVTQNGQDLFEQVYAVQRGANFGWSVWEGSHSFYPQRQLGPTPHTLPTFEHPHSEARSLTGGVTYYGQRYPELRGAIIYGDYSTGKIWAGRLNAQGQPEWNREIADTTLAITSFATDADGELLITDHQGAGKGGLYTLEVNPVDPASAKSFPRTLSASGLFESVKDHQMAAGVIPYSVNSPLWSDGSRKVRFIALPESSGTDGQPPQMTVHTTDAWSFPNGTVLVKSFALPLAAAGDWRWIETRFMVRQENEWEGYSYAWNEEGTDAVLVEGAGRSISFRVQDAEGMEFDQTWRFPSRTECMVCHSRAAGYVLGLSTLQMNRDHDYGGVVDNQLRSLTHAGILKGLDKSPQDCARLADPADEALPLESRVRSYLHANCAHCHVESGGGNSQMNLKFNAQLEATKLIGVKPVHHTFGLTDAELIAPGAPERSVLLHRMKIQSAGQMPQLARSLPDPQAIELLTKWIQSLPPSDDSKGIKRHSSPLIR